MLGMECNKGSVDQEIYQWDTGSERELVHLVHAFHMCGMHVQGGVCMYMYTPACMCVHPMHVCVYTYMHVHAYTCIHVHAYMCIHVYAYTSCACTCKGGVCM